MRYYRELKVGERLQAGDERISDDQREWLPIQSSIGLAINADMLASYRRPVDLPVLQRVTPEAMAELEGKEALTIAVLSQASAKTMAWLPSLGLWLSRAGHDSPLEWHWFVDLATIPEVTE